MSVPIQEQKRLKFFVSFCKVHMFRFLFVTIWVKSINVMVVVMYMIENPSVLTCMRFVGSSSLDDFHPKISYLSVVRKRYHIGCDIISIVKKNT